ncbi:MAG: hypothetical protein AB7V01_16990 [Vicinamibacterales bacterium]
MLSRRDHRAFPRLRRRLRGPGEDHLRALCAGAAAAVLCLSVLPASAGQADTRLLPLPPGRTLALDVTVGDVDIEGWDRPEAQIVIERRGPGDEALQKLPIEVKETPGAVTVSVVQADGATDPALRSRVRLRLPAGARLEHIRIFEGTLAIEDFSGDVRADVRRGDITATRLGGTARFETGIGDVVVKAPRLEAGGLLHLRTFNGDVRLSFDGAPPDARIMALALSGTIESDIPLTMKDAWGPRWGETTLGAGDPVVSIDIVTGRVRIETR